MKWRFNPTNSFLLTILGLVIVFSLFSYYPGHGDYGDAVIEGDEYITPDETPEQAARRADSLKLVEDCKAFALYGGGDGMSYFIHGYRKMDDDRSCPLLPKPAVVEPNYYLVLPGYYIKPDARFSVENGKYYLQTVAWDSVKSPKGYRKGHFVKKEITVRYTTPRTDPYVATFPKPGEVLIPVSKSGYGTLKIITHVSMILFALLAIWFLLIPLLVIARAMWGKKLFYPGTVRQYKKIGWGLIVLACLPVLSSILFKLLYSSRIPAELYISVFQGIKSKTITLILGLVALLAANNVDTGATMQEDIDLTH